MPDHKELHGTSRDLAALLEGIVANRRRSIDRSDPLGRLALRLRSMQAAAIARAGSSAGAQEISIDRVAAGDRWRTSRTSIYAALSGTRLPSVDTLCAMVVAWDPAGEAAIPAWLSLRDEAEEQIIGQSLSRGGRRASSSASATSKLPSSVSAEDLSEVRRTLRYEMVKNDMRAVDLARRAMLGRTTVSQALNGERTPTWATVAAICRALKLPEEQIKDFYGLWHPSDSPTAGSILI